MEKSSRTASIQQNIAQLAQSAADLQERCDEINETLNLKTGGEGGGGASAGNTIVRLKDGLKVIKTEIKDMNMSITLLNNNLLELRKEGVQRGRDHYYQRRQRQQKQKAKGADNISVLSDDELID